MALPLINATLTKIEGGGTSEDYGTPAGTPTTRFSGSAPAYLTERIMALAGQSLNEVREDRLVLEYEVGNLVRLEDRVTFSTDGVVQTRKVRDVQRYLLFGTVRLRFYSE